MLHAKLLKSEDFDKHILIILRGNTELLKNLDVCWNQRTIVPQTLIGQILTAPGQGQTTPGVNFF